jgi:ferredoxin
MVHVNVDRSRCVGLGVCESVMPDLFEIDDDGVLMVHEDGVVPQDKMSEAEAAVWGCPVEALTLVSD